MPALFLPSITMPPAEVSKKLKMTNKRHSEFAEHMPANVCETDEAYCGQQTTVKTLKLRIQYDCKCAACYAHLSTCQGLGSGACGWHGLHCRALTSFQTSSAARPQLQVQLPSVTLNWQTWPEWAHWGWS